MLCVDVDNNNDFELCWCVCIVNGVNLIVNYNFVLGEFVLWMYVVGIYDGVIIVFYINGAQVASGVGNGQPIMQANDVFCIGKGSDVATPIEVWNGELDEVCFWPFARSAEDI